LTGSEDAPPGGQIYIQGDHFGIIDLGLSAEIGAYEVQAYRHFVYEDRDNLKFKSPQDGLFGLEIANTEGTRWIDRLLYEHLYTKWQNGPIGPGYSRGGAGGRDDYYNHGIWRNGWTLYSRTAGTPLLTPHSSEGRPGIGNNRVVGHHLGVAGHAGPLEYRILATYTRNYGTYDDRQDLENEADYRFQPPLEQTSFLVETRMLWPSRPWLEVTGAVGVDAGGLYENSIGGRIGLVYHPLR